MRDEGYRPRHKRNISYAKAMSGSVRRLKRLDLDQTLQSSINKIDYRLLVVNDQSATYIGK